MIAGAAKRTTRPPLILIVEDEPNLRDVLGFQLENAGFEVQQAANGEEALFAIEQQIPDLMLTSTMMSGMSGLDLIRKVRSSARTQLIPIIVLTAKSSMDDKCKGLELGANDYITKPWQARELTLRIRNLIYWTHVSSWSRSKGEQYHSCFISYAGRDEQFAARLHLDLLNAGVICWKWNEDAKVGHQLWEDIDTAIRNHDKMILIASEASLKSPAVGREIERAMQEEDSRFTRAQKGEVGLETTMLFPLRLDDYILTEWQHGRRADVVNRFIADARNWDTDTNVYPELCERLLRDLARDGRVT